MNLLLSENEPESCSMLGLDCNTCMRKSAASVARICHGLDSRGIQQLFLQLYPSNGCQPMAPMFEAAYCEASGVAMPLAIAAVAAA